jgi:salicylate 5-hydroxylase large subunit
MSPRAWPAEGVTRIPYWVYTDVEIYERELERIFGGPSWSYVGLACELPNPGDFLRTTVGETPIVLVRGRDGQVRALVNRCSHRGAQFCRESRGSATRFECPYHQWSYGLDGQLVGVPLQRGIEGRGGMPESFDPSLHRLEALRVTERNGVLFASFSEGTEPFEDYLGPAMSAYFDRLFDGRELHVLGYLRQRLPCNWKLMFENVKDPYHATLLHVFLVSFGLFRADNPSATVMDATGRHSALISARREEASEATTSLGAYKRDLALHDPTMLTPVREFPGEATVVMQTVWPNLVLQQQSNTLALRQLVPRGPNAHDLHWTFFGYESDSDEMTAIRLRQANLMGPAGFVSVDDGEVMRMLQEGAAVDGARAAFVEAGEDAVDDDVMVTEAAIRGFYGHYRSVMDL